MNRPHEPSAIPGPLEHRTRSLAFGIFILALGVLAGAGARETSSREQDALRQLGPDTRQVITLPAAQRDMLLNEMRGMLTAMQSVMEAASRLDVPRIRSVAQSAGTAAISIHDAAFQDQLPDGFRRQEAATRSEFDGLAEAVRGFTARDTVLAYLSRISQGCVSCHAKYRLTAKE